MSGVNVRYMVNDVNADVAFYTKHLGFAAGRRLSRGAEKHGVDQLSSCADGLPQFAGRCAPSPQ